MKYYFQKDKDGINDTITNNFNAYLRDKSFSSNSEYRKIITGLKHLIRQAKVTAPKIELFNKEIRLIRKQLALTEKTTWGGVSLKYVDVDNNSIRKLLVIKKLGVLGFEYHRLKREKLIILEGACIVLYSNHKSKNWKKGRVSYELAKPMDKFEFQAFDEHGIIALTDCVIEEQSTNHLDDLIWVYQN